MIDLKKVTIDDSVYYYDRWWRVTAIYWDTDHSEEGRVSCKDKDGNPTNNITASQITEHKPKDE